MVSQSVISTSTYQISVPATAAFCAALLVCQGNGLMSRSMLRRTTVFSSPAELVTVVCGSGRFAPGYGKLS